MGVGCPTFFLRLLASDAKSLPAHDPNCAPFPYVGAMVLCCQNTFFSFFLERGVKRILNSALSRGDVPIRSSKSLRGFVVRSALAMIAWLALALAAPMSHAVIPSTERTALQALYTSTNGASWTTSTNWNGAVGTECTWFGVTCSAGDANVIFIVLNSNNLTGILPSLSAFTALENFTVSGNSIVGPIPALASVTTLKNFSAGGNGLTGSIPPLAGLTSLVNFRVGSNQLTGSIPSLAGLTALEDFDVQVNQLAGPIPSLAGLTALQQFQAYGNQLSGSIPALAGLTTLGTFFVYGNQLTGSIPALTGLTGLNEFDVSNNQLTGALPSLTGLTDLDSFRVANNQLTGAVPAAPPPLDPGQCANAVEFFVRRLERKLHRDAEFRC
jgi:hypothetical protein